MANVISNASSLSRKPVILKMLITSQELCEDHIQSIKPYCMLQNDYIIAAKNNSIPEHVKKIANVNLSNYEVFNLDKVMEINFLEIGKEKGNKYKIEEFIFAILKNALNFSPNFKISEKTDSMLFRHLFSKVGK